MQLRPIALLLAACGIGANLFAELPNRDRGRDLDARGRRHHAKAAGDAEQDDATARRVFMREWYGEWTPEYRKFMLHAAAVERQRYSEKMPSVYGQRLMGLAAAGSSWVNLGPTNADSETNGGTLYVRDSGRPVSIVVDPTNTSIIYNATAEGGVWKTTNGGTNWTPITETLGSLSCGCLVMDPNNSSTLYLGLGDSFNGTGIGLVKSTDGGATWSAPVFLGASTMIRDLKVSSTNSQVVLAATNMGFFRSTDGGATWTKVAIATGAAKDPSCWSLAWGGGTNWALSLESDTTVTTGSGQIWASSDDGATWTQSTGFSQATVGVTRATLASAPSQPSTMYAYAAGSKSWSTSDAGQDLADFYRSTDGGRTWSAFGVGGSSTQYTNSNSDSTYVRNVLGGQAWYNQMLIVDPSNPATVYAGGNLALIKITSASSAPSYSVMSNWLAQYSLPYVHADFHAGTIDRNGTMYMGTDGGIFKQTSAASNTWTSDLNIGIVSHLIYSVGSSLNNRSAIIGGFQDNGTRVRSGSTSTFNQQIGGDGFGAHMNAVNASTMLGTLYYARVYKSTDGGATFASASTGITESNNSSSAPFATRIVPGLADATGNTVYTFSNLNVYQSTDYAGSWSALPAAPITTGAIRGVGVAKSNASVMGVVCSGGRVFLSANGGSSWTTPAALPNTGNYMSYIWFDTNNSSVVYVASVAPDSTKTHLWKSSNSGGSWTAIDGSGFPAGIPVNAIQNDPGDSNTLYAGTNLGVYKSTDGGSTWTRFGSGLPLVDVTDFYLAPDSSLMRASTFGRGFWELTNATPANTVTASITTPATNVTIASGTAQSFVGTGTDSSSTATLSYSWAYGDGVSGTGASTSHTYTNTGATAATYTATLAVTDNTGVSSTATRAITVNPAPANTVTASITTPASNVTIASGTAQSFAGTGTDSSSTATLSYAWTFGDGGTATGASASHTYTNTGTTAATYTATLKVTDNTGVSSTATRAITVSPATGGTTTSQVLGNPGFETGTASPWAMSTGVLDNGTTQPAHSGSWKAWLCGYGSSHTDTVMQQVAIPANATAASLSFWLHIDTAEASGVHDTLAVQVRNSAGTVLGTLATYSNLNANTGYSQVSFDLSAYKGQTIQINLVGTEDATNQTSFVVDDFALNVTTPASTPSNTVTASITTPASNVTVTSGTAQSFAGSATDSSSTATLTYAWNFGDGSTATGATASHTYTNTGTAAATYTATFTATDNTGVSSSATRTVTVNPAGGSGGTELVTNGGFESGTTGWSGTTADIGTFTGEPAHTGTKNCWLLGNGSTATESIQQQAFTVPAAGATLTFWLHIDTAETTTTNAYDTLQVQVLNSAGTVLGTLATYSNLNAASGYTQRTFSLAAYAGQTITLKFLGNEDASLQTSFVIDDVSAK